MPRESTGDVKKWSSFSEGIAVRYGGTPCKLGTVDAETGGSQFEPICTENLSQKQRGRDTNRRVQSKYPNIRQDKTPAATKVERAAQPFATDFEMTGSGSRVRDAGLETDEWMRLIRAGRAHPETMDGNNVGWEQSRERNERVWRAD